MKKAKKSHQNSQNNDVPSDPARSRSGGLNRTIPYQSGHTRALWAIWLMAGCLLTYLGTMVSKFQELFCLIQQQLGWIEAKQSLDLAEPPIFFRQLPSSSVFRVLTIVAFIAFLMWLHRVYRNLAGLNVKNLNCSPGWAVGYYFIPILNLFRPYQVMKEIWQKSEPNLKTKSVSVPVSSLIRWWWAFWLLPFFIGLVSYHLSIRAVSISEQLTACSVALCCICTTTISKILTILVIRSIDRRQDARYRLLTGKEV
ncbi:MAG: DUF4328 domain-containing protein [Pirellulales bacterium]|nr:DUF4328 domain-containing protein [Pirellulales bacterium]